MVVVIIIIHFLHSSFGKWYIIRDVKFIAVFAEKSGTEAPMNITSDSAPEHFCIHLIQQGLSVLFILRFGQEMFEFC